jgi:SAM-dependent methyltransferase
MASNAISLVYRYVVQSRLEALFHPGDRVLDVGGGDGETARYLASRGVRVVGIDPSAGADWTRPGEASFDGAYSDFGALNAADLREVGSGLAAVLRPGAPVLVSLLGPSPLPAAVCRALTGLGERRRDPRGPEVAGTLAYPTRAEAQRALGRVFTWTDAYALGVLVPSPAQESWAIDHPQAFGAVAALERAVRRWPGLRDRGDYVVLEGRRTEAL